MFPTIAVVASTFLLASGIPTAEKRSIGVNIQGINPSLGLHASGAVPFAGALPPNFAFHGSPANPFQVTSLNGWGGFQNLNDFDNFHGVNDFSGHRALSSLVVKQQPQLVCKAVPVHVIQQQLLVVREYVKRLVVQQICEVEVQTIVFSQFQAGVFDFGHDLRRVSGRAVGFDAHLASQIANLHNAQGDIFGKDLQFTGQKFGQDFVQVGGNNWNDATSPITVHNAFTASQSAFVGGNVYTAPVPSSPIPAFVAPPQASSAVVPPPVETAPPVELAPAPGPGVSNVTDPALAPEPVAPQAVGAVAIPVSGRR